MAGEPKPKRSLDDIVKDTVNSNFGISDADLNLLFEDEPTTVAPAPTEPTVTPSPETATPPAPAAEPTAPVVAAATPPAAQPEPPKVVEPASNKSEYDETINDLKSQIAQLNALVQEREARARQTTPATSQTPDPLDEITDEAIISSPKENIVKTIYAILKTTLPTAFTEYDQAVTSREMFKKFRTDHPDFDELRSIMKQVVAENPAANDNLAALPRVYGEAKRRKAAALAAMKKELNIEPPATPPTPPSNPSPQLSEEQVLDKLEQRLREKIRVRKAASGTLTADQSAPVTPAERQTPRETEKPLTADEQIMKDMLEAGPPSTQWLKGLELTSAKK